MFPWLPFSSISHEGGTGQLRRAHRDSFTVTSAFFPGFRSPSFPMRGTGMSSLHAPVVLISTRLQRRLVLQERR